MILWFPCPRVRCPSIGQDSQLLLGTSCGERTHLLGWAGRGCRPAELRGGAAAAWVEDASRSVHPPTGTAPAPLRRTTADRALRTEMPGSKQSTGGEYAATYSQFFTLLKQKYLSCSPNYPSKQSLQNMSEVTGCERRKMEISLEKTNHC